MKKSIQSPARGQGANYSHQVLQLRPGLGVRVSTVNPTAWALRKKQPAQLAETRRGKVSGFSSASAARLRDTFFFLDFPRDRCFGLALTTAPWVKRGPEDAFVALQDEAKRCKGLQCAIWRKEVTKKGVPHYHLAVWVTDPSKALEVWCWLTQRWVHHLLRDGVCPGVAYLSGSKAFKRHLPTSPDSWTYFGREALEHVNCRFNLRSRVDKGNLVELNLDSAIQYLCDHTSKHKAYQAKTTGRAWGIWKRSFLPRMVVPGVSLENCPPRLLSDIRKALGKISRYWYPVKGAAFGYRWSRQRRFNSGKKVLFRSGAVDAVKRLVQAWNEAGDDQGPADACLVPAPRRLG